MAIKVIRPAPEVMIVYEFHFQSLALYIGQFYILSKSVCYKLWSMGLQSVCSICVVGFMFAKPSIYRSNTVFTGKFGIQEKSGNEMGWSLFPTEFSVPVFYSGIPGFFPFTRRFSTDAGPQSNLLISSQARPVLLPGQGGTNRGALLLLAPCAALPALLPRLPTPACSWASGHGLLFFFFFEISGHGLLATLGSTQKLWAK